jgi:bifunctional non-homologous end joining protein LigD
MPARTEVEVEIEGRKLRLSNVQKVFYPETGFTKGDVIDYYVRVAPVVLPHLRDRPLTLKRYPEGAQGPYFYEKRCPPHAPAWIRTAPVWSRANDAVIRFCVLDDLASLVWAANLADLELHTYLHRVPDVDHPTALVFDLDPGPPADAVQCCEVALVLRALFERLGLAAFPKSSGSKGVQVYVPLDGAAGYDRTKAFARAVAAGLERERPHLVVSSMKKTVRAGKVFVDWSQNDVHKTTVCVYSLRARERPTVSTPLRWEEVEEAHRRRDAGGLIFDAAAVLRRVERLGDLFAPVLTLRQALPSAGAEGHRGAARVTPGGAAPPPAPGRAQRPGGSPKAARGAHARQPTSGRAPAPRANARPAAARAPRGRSRRAGRNA